MGSKLSRLKECGGKQVQSEKGFLAGPHVIGSAYWTLRPGWICAGKECDGLAQGVQIKDDEWAPYARMRSRICLRMEAMSGGQCSE